MPTDIAIDLRSLPTDRRARALLSQLTIRAIEAAAGTRLMLHAAGVADNQDDVVALVGPSGMGKTTASVYLSRHGFGYVTDENVSIGLAGDVLQFARPLSLRRPGGNVQQSPDELGLGRPSGELRIARIVLLDRVAGCAGPPTLTPVPHVEALLQLIPHTSALAQLRDPLQQMSRITDQCGGVFRLMYAEMDERVGYLLSDLLSNKASAPDPWQAVGPQRQRQLEPARKRPVRGDDQELFQGDITDGVRTDAEALFLINQVPVRLGAVGLAIWEAAREGIAEREITSIVEHEHGEHPEAGRIVREAVDQMLEAALLVSGADYRPAPAASR